MNLQETIRVLYDAGVEFVVIGRVAMGLQGSAHLTKGMDFCYERSGPNIQRLARAFRPYHLFCAARRQVCLFNLMQKQFLED